MAPVKSHTFLISNITAILISFVVLLCFSCHISHIQLLPQSERSSAHCQALGCKFTCHVNMWFTDVCPIVDVLSSSHGNNVMFKHSKSLLPLYLNYGLVKNYSSIALSHIRVLWVSLLLVLNAAPPPTSVKTDSRWQSGSPDTNRF